MKRSNIIGMVVLLLLAVVASSCNLPLQSAGEMDNQGEKILESPPPAPPNPTAEIQPTEAVNDQETGETTKLVRFGPLGISLEIPADLYVHKNPSFNYDDPSKLDGYILYIQNYGWPGGSNSGDFQIYGILQYSPRPISWEEFAANNLNSPMNESVTEIEVNGIRGFDTFPSGERKRFIYQFLLDGQVLTLAVSAANENNKALADQIISTMQFDPAQFSTESNIQRIVEPNSRYQMFVPDDWEYSFGTPIEIRLSDFQASSSDFEVVVEDTDGPHSKIYIKSGVQMSFVILDSDLALSEPIMAEIKSSYQEQISGIVMQNYIFTEPSTVEGELWEVRFYHNELSYILRFSYGEGVDQDFLYWILINMEIPQE